MIPLPLREREGPARGAGGRVSARPGRPATYFAPSPDPSPEMGEGSQVFSRYPVLNIHQTMARQRKKKPSVAARLTATAMSAVP